MAETLRLADGTERTPDGIAVAIAQQITAGELVPGRRLPTVRETAKLLGVSPTTVSEAWRILRSHGAITTDGRRGTFVRGPRQGASPGRYWQVPVDAGTFSIDLSTGNPDPALLPPLRPVLDRVEVDLPVRSYLDPPVLPDLDAELRRRWPFEPELLTMVDGAQDALDRLVDVLVGLGDTVVVEDPAFPPLLDLLDAAGARTIGVPLDDEGPDPDALEHALRSSPTALFLQPRSHNPTGVTMSARRCAELATLVAGTDVTVVEDDHTGDVSGTVLHSLGGHVPDRVVHVRSFSKSHGPELRLAAVGGAAGPIDALVRRRRLGPSWSSRLLQQVLALMLGDDTTIAHVVAAERAYARRRAHVVEALGSHGLEVGGDSGINVWVPVVDERIAVVSLAANGIGAAPGTPFTVRPGRPQHLRLSIGAVADDDIDELAGRVARAARA